MPPHPPDPDEPRFTDEELRLILHRAAERQVRAPDPAAAGRSLAEIQAIAEEAGIDPAQVAREAALVRAERRPAHAAGPRRQHVAYEITVPAELPEAARSGLLEYARELTRQRGSITGEQSALVWTATDGFGVTRVSVATRPGSTHIVVSEDRTSSAIAAGIGALLLGVAVAVMAVPLLFAAGVDLALGVAIGLGLAGAVTWAGARLYMRRQTARWRARAQWLGEALERQARQALPDSARPR